MRTVAPPSEAEVNALVREIEDRLDLLSLTVDGTSLWQLVRFEVSIRRQRGGLARAPLRRGRLLKGVWNGMWQYIRPARTCRYLCKTFDSAHRGQGKGGTRDIYFDSLCDAITGGAKMSSCDVVGFEEKIAAAVRPPVFDDTLVIVASAVLGRFWPHVRTHEAFGRLAEAIATEFGYADYTAERLVRLYNVYRWRVALYRRVLRKFAPELVFTPDSGQFALMKACNEVKIPFVELQHGIFTAVHPNSLPSAVKGAPGILEPSALAAYGGFTRDALADTLLHADDRIVPVGAPTVEHFRQVRDTTFRPAQTIVVTLTTQGIDGSTLRTRAADARARPVGSRFEPQAASGL